MIARLFALVFAVLAFYGLLFAVALRPLRRTPYTADHAAVPKNILDRTEPVI